MSGLHPYQLTMAAFGQRVNRASETLPQTAQTPYFRISGGRVFITRIIGEVTVLIETQTDNAQLVYNHATESDVDLCADLDITADAVGTLYTITGDFSDALLSGFALESDIVCAPFVLGEGTIDLDCSASNDGETAWTLFYFPIDDGAIVTAV